MQIYNIPRRVWHDWFSCKGRELKIFRCELALSSEPQIWKFHLVLRQIKSKLHQKACCTWSTIIFPHSTNQIIDLWRCRGRCHQHFLNFLIGSFYLYPCTCCSWHMYVIIAHAIELIIFLHCRCFIFHVDMCRILSNMTNLRVRHLVKCYEIFPLNWAREVGCRIFTTLLSDFQQVSVTNGSSFSLPIHVSRHFGKPSRRRQRLIGYSSIQGRKSHICLHFFFLQREHFVEN